MLWVFDLKIFYLNLPKDIDGREVRVRFSAEMNPGRRNLETMNSTPRKVIYYESRHKLYIGNLARSVQVQELWNHFSRFGHVVSARILHDYKEGKNRIYAFVSFLSASERDAALSLDGTVNSAFTCLLIFLIGISIVHFCY